MTDLAVLELYIRDLLVRLNKSVVYCVLHGYELLPKIGSDLDIAVLPEDYSTARRVICEVASTYGGVLLKEVEYDISDSRHLIIGLQDGSVVVVDIIFDSVPVGVYGLDATALVAGRRRLGSCFTPAPEVEAEYLLSKRSVKGTLSQEQLAKIRDTAAFEVPSDLAGALAVGRSRRRARRVATGWLCLARLRSRKIVRRALGPVGDYFAGDDLHANDFKRLSMIYRRVVVVPPLGPLGIILWIATAPVRRMPLRAYVFKGKLPRVERLGDQAVLSWLRSVP